MNKNIFRSKSTRESESLVALARVLRLAITDYQSKHDNANNELACALRDYDDVIMHIDTVNERNHRLDAMREARFDAIHYSSASTKRGVTKVK